MNKEKGKNELYRENEMRREMSQDASSEAEE